MQMHLSSFLLILLTVGGVQARPLFDFLPPVIINEEQRMTNNNNAHNSCPLSNHQNSNSSESDQGWIQTGRGNSTIYEKPHQGQSNRNPGHTNHRSPQPDPEQNQRGVQKHPQQSTGSTIHTLWITQEEVSGSSIWDCWNGFWSGESNRNYQDQLSNFEKHPQDRYVGRYHTTS